MSSNVEKTRSARATVVVLGPSATGVLRVAQELKPDMLAIIVASERGKINEGTRLLLTALLRYAEMAKLNCGVYEVEATDWTTAVHEVRGILVNLASRYDHVDVVIGEGAPGLITMETVLACSSLPEVAKQRTSLVAVLSDFALETIELERVDRLMEVEQRYGELVKSVLFSRKLRFTPSFAPKDVRNVLAEKGYKVTYQRAYEILKKLCKKGLARKLERGKYTLRPLP